MNRPEYSTIPNQNTNILIVGLGLIGGSYAEVLTARGYRVSAITKAEEDVRYALSRGMVHRAAASPDPDLIGEAELIVFALYPSVFLDWIEKYQHLIRPGALLTDVTGIKGEVVGRVQKMLRPDLEFIGAHPMAGRERSGVAYADGRVFRGANYIVTPTERNSPEAIAACRRLGEILGFARISELSPAEHDTMIAYLSQLTHAIAVALMTADDCPHSEKYTGDSFRDLTRIAKINDEMWSELFLMNRDALLSQMDAFLGEFSVLREKIAAGDREGIRQMMRAAARRRTAFDKPETSG